MKEIIIQKNENEQRLDRFLQKYLERAPRNFIFKMIRKKNIKVNGKKATPEMIIYAGDRIQLFLSDETIEKFLGTREHIKSHLKLDIVYEDRNIILINKNEFVLRAQSLGLDRKLKAGTFRIKTNSSLDEIIKILAQGN